MNIKKITLLATTCIVAISGVFLLNDSSKEKYFPRANTAFDIASQSANGAFSYLSSIRDNSVTGGISVQEQMAAKNHAAKMKKGNKALNVSWSFKGPDNVGGRTRALMMDINDTLHMYAGGVSGGLWESTNGGQSWFPYDDEFSVVNISCIAQSSDGTIYVGTGSTFDRETNFKAKNSSFVGTGLYKLTGNGNYQKLIGPDESLDFGADWARINEIAIDPNDPQKLWVATNIGVQESLDGGNNWGLPSNPPPAGSGLEADDIQITADGKITVTYSVGGRAFLFASSDNGANWTSAIFNDNASRIEVAIAPSNTDIMYAAVGRFIGQNDPNQSCTQGVYQSIDAGVTWVELENTPDYFSSGGSCQGDYDNAIIVYPNDPGKILVGGVSLFQWVQSPAGSGSSIQGEWRPFATTREFSTLDGSRNFNYVHADKHYFLFHPTNVNKLYIATDGGIAFTFLADFPRPAFGQYNLGYNTTQFYDIAVSTKDFVTAGAQDNGTQLVGFNFNTGQSGTIVNGGDGFESELFAINPTLGFVSSQNGNYGRLQGIGTSLGTSTFNVADVFSGKLADICNIGGGTCSGSSFYTTMAKWESFNHQLTKDSVPVLLTLSELPPLAKGTKIPFESKNNFYPLVDSLPTDTFPLAGDTIWATVNKLDTNFVGLAQNGSTQIITAFDTIVIRTDSNWIIFRYRGDGTAASRRIDTVPLVYGTQVDYRNAFYNPVTSSNLLSVLVAQDGSTARYIDPKIEFVYRFEFPDIVQSAVAVFNIRGPNPQSAADAGRTDIWISKDVLKGSSVNEPLWIKIADPGSIPTASNNSPILSATFSNDGDHLFYGTVSGEVYRIDNINDLDVSILNNRAEEFAIDNVVSQQRIATFTSGPRRAVTGITVDPQNDDNVIVTLGNYGNTEYIFRSVNATSSGDVIFENISGRGADALPNTPVYEAMIDFRDNNKVLVATELGVFGTENAFTSNSYPVDTTYIAQDTIINPGDTLIIPADTVLITPVDSMFIMADTIPNFDTTIVIDTIVIPTVIRIDSTVIPPDTIVLDSVVIFRSNSNITVIDSTFIMADTIITPAVFDTIPADTVRAIPADTTIITADTIIGTNPDVIWTEENTNLGRVPVHSIKQMTFGWAEGAVNQGKIYIGTHGRGVFETDQFVGINEQANNNSSKPSSGKGKLVVYPNPVVDNMKIDLVSTSPSTVNIQIFSLTGQLVREMTESLTIGKNIVSLQMNELDRGTYIIRTSHDGETSTGKFIKQ